MSAGLILTKKISMTSLNETFASFDCNIPVVMYYLVVECQGIDCNDLHWVTNQLSVNFVS